MLKFERFSILCLAFPFVFNSIILAKPTEFSVAGSGRRVGQDGKRLAKRQPEDVNTTANIPYAKREISNTVAIGRRVGQDGKRFVKRKPEEGNTTANSPYAKREISNTVAIGLRVGQDGKRFVKRKPEEGNTTANIPYAKREISNTVAIGPFNQHQGSGHLSRRHLDARGEDTETQGRSKRGSNTLSRRGTSMKRLETRSGISHSPGEVIQGKRQKRDPHHTENHNDEDESTHSEN